MMGVILVLSLVFFLIFVKYSCVWPRTQSNWNLYSFVHTLVPEACIIGWSLLRSLVVLSLEVYGE